MAKVTPIASVRTILDAADDAAASSGVVALLNTSSHIIVNSSGTDTDRGVALVAAYTAAKALTPNGAALSATNRAVVIIPPGAYKVTSSFSINTNFVDFSALIPERGGDRLSTDDDDTGVQATPLTEFRPPNAYIYSDESVSPFTVVTQSVYDVGLHGFGIAALGAYTAFDFGGVHAFHCSLTSDESNSSSKYTKMYFWHRMANMIDFGDGPKLPVSHIKHVAGEWDGCISNSYGWRCGVDGVFKATMRDCQFGPFSVGGDLTGASFGTCRLERCIGIGDADNSGLSGYSCFGGCNVNGISAISTSVFVACEGGERSFNVGANAGGQYIRCRAGRLSFGATYFSSHPGEFSGYAEDCFAGADSYGGSNVVSYGNNTGTMLRCKGEGNTNTIRCTGAEIRESRISATTTGVHALTLLDSNSVISNSDLIVMQGGTGVPIHAASALNVAAYACRMNNATNDADGLGANVTNLVSNSGNVVSNAIK